MADSPKAARGRRPRRESFRTWEIVVIGIAIVLFLLAAFAGPSEQAPPPVAAPSATPSAEAPATPTPAASDTASPTPTATPPAGVPTDAPTAAPVATVDQILAEEVGDYLLADRMPSEPDPESTALEAVDLRYTLSPSDEDTDILHAIEIHPDDVAARARVRTFGEALERTGYRVLREQSLRDDEGAIQGYFISLRNQGQPLLLWSNRNATFTLGGGPDADVNAFYDMLPY